MHQLMNHYRLITSGQRPRIIGLTGMLIGASVHPSNVIEELDDLEATFQAKIITVQTVNELKNVLVYSTKPQERIIRYQDIGVNNPVERTMNRITKIVDRLVDQIENWPIDVTHQRTNSYMLRGEITNASKFLRTLMNDFIYQMNDMGLYGASISILSTMVDLELKKRCCDTMPLKRLIRQLITGAELIRHIIVDEIDDADDDDDDDNDEDDGSGEDAKILTNATPKLLTLICKLKQHLRDNDASQLKALVFVHRRYTAKCIYHVLQRYAACNPKTFPIRADFMVGNNSKIPESVEGILENKWNRKVVERFERNEINLIVASSVLEEGIDLQSCNLVLSYDTPKTFRSYVQTKGRARHETSVYILMVGISEDTQMCNKLKEYQLVDAILKKYLIGRSVDRSMPLQVDVDRQFADDPIQPYRTCKGAILESASAIQLLNRYCMTLPKDDFTMPSVIFKKTVDKEHMVKISIQLPMQSVVKEIIFVSYEVMIFCVLFVIFLVC